MFVKMGSKLISLILLLKMNSVLGIGCPSRWFDCGNGKCISELWLCDGDNDCGNLNDEHDCENRFLPSLCLSSQFACESDKHCIPKTWHCDGERDCDDGSDELKCDTIGEPCNGFQCRDHHCISSKWRCDKYPDCPDGSDEELCPTEQLCSEGEFRCSSSSCLNRSLVCDGKEDCSDGSDEGIHCGEGCENISCSQKCEETPSGPQCYCEDGYRLDKNDNKTCIDIDECQQDGFCSHTCVNAPGSFKCACHDGYELIDRSCKAKGSDPLLVMSTLRDIRGIRIRSGQYFLIRKAIHKALSADVDPNGQNMFWIEISNRSSIYSGKLDGTGFKTVLSHGLLVPEDISVDYIANNLYITDSGLQQILACKMEGTMCHVLHYKNVEKPRSIALDLEKGFMYWSDWGENAVGIYRSGMDGSRRIPLVSKRIAWPNSIAIDHTTNRLYWTDTKLNYIEYISLDKNVRKVVLNSTVFRPYSLAVFEDAIYWTDKMTFSLETCNKFTGHNMSLVARENGKNIRAVHIYHPVLTAKVPNPCWSNDCSHMCLISPESGFRCACPQGFKISVDGKTCTIKENSASLFLSEGSSIYYIRPEAVGSETVTALPHPLNSAMITGISYDKKSKCLFVADVNTPAIYSVNLTSMSTRELVDNEISSPDGLSFDYNSNNLYWIDSSKETVEVISIYNLKRVILLKNLMKPVALAVSPSQGLMFIATIGMQGSLTMYDMDGKNKKTLSSVQGQPLSLALHPFKNILYWADPRDGTISYVNLRSSSTRIVKSGIDKVMSIAASEEYLYWTARKREINLLKGNTTFVLQLPGQEKGIVIRKLIYVSGTEEKEKSECRVNNGGCSFICLSSPNGRTCACPSDLMLARDNVNCIAKRCEVQDFRCMNNGRCISLNLRCDGRKDCDDGSDEVGCGNRCSGDDFQCKNGRCILKSWRCDRRNDCVDNSDEENCPEDGVCSKEQFSCQDGECIAALWRCDGETDCANGSDEVNCDTNVCDPESQLRCDHGQCVPISWVCDGTNDCHDGSDEKNCYIKPKTCSQNEFLCEADGKCLDVKLKCDKTVDCTDGSDEKHCSSLISCPNDEFLCATKKLCISYRRVCDGFDDCSDGSDERNCDNSRRPPPNPNPKSSASECEDFFCYSSGECLPWSKVCDGHLDCENLPDEGGLCSRACPGDNGGCSQICKKTPQGSRCLCLKGYRLLRDNKTCDDINECLEPGTCSHFCNNTKGGFKCSCADGYFLNHDHRSCKADGGSAMIVYLTGDQIKGFDLVSHAPSIYVNMKNADMSGMDYNAAEGVFYWTEFHDGSINSYSPHTERQDIIVKRSPKPINVRYDWIAKNLYFSDFQSRIGVCSKDGRFCKILIRSNITTIDSIAISPTTGQMFWTSWLTQSYQYSGVIERAEMDGSNRLAIVSQNTIMPTSVTVDHVLKVIYWTDGKMDTLECADFDGSNRHQVVRYDMYSPYAMTVFEDHVYWADWGTDSIVKCEKFRGSDCSQIKEKHVKALVLLIVHKVMQPKGNNRCSNSGCHQLCLLKHSTHVCACDDEFIERKGYCQPRPPTTTNPLLKCPKHYCLDDIECVVKNGSFVCNCPKEYTGKFCGKIVRKKESSYDWSWIVFTMFAFLVLELIVLFKLLCCKNKAPIKNMVLCCDRSTSRRKAYGRNRNRGAICFSK